MKALVQVHKKVHTTIPSAEHTIPGRILVVVLVITLKFSLRSCH